eukprot:gene9962-11012_t
MNKLKNNAIAPTPTTGGVSMSGTGTASRAGEQSLSRVSSHRQGWADFIFGYLMRAQLDSDLMGSSAHPSSAPPESNHGSGMGRSQSGATSNHNSGIALSQSGSGAIAVETPNDEKAAELRSSAMISS